MNLGEALQLVQGSVGPAIIISACGLLLLTMTNRLGRTIDRSRLLSKEATAASPVVRASLARQLQVILQRARYLRTAILFATLCILLVAVLILSIFVFSSLHVAGGLVVGVLFCGAMVCLAISQVYFLRDIFLALRAMEIEVADVARGA